MLPRARASERQAGAVRRTQCIDFEFVSKVDAVVLRKPGRLEPQWSEREEPAAVECVGAEGIPIDARL